MKLKVEEIKHMILRSQDLVQIIDEKLEYSGPAFLIPWKYMERTAKSFRAEVETRRKDWRKAGTWAPMNPEAAAHMEFKDVVQRLYYVITLE